MGFEAALRRDLGVDSDHYPHQLNMKIQEL